MPYAYDNPDSLLTCAIVRDAYALWRERPDVALDVHAADAVARHFSALLSQLPTARPAAVVRKQENANMALHHAQHGEVVQLAALGADRQHAQTTALVKTDDFEAIHLIVHAGTVIPRHRVEGQITLQCLRGSVGLLLGETKVTLGSGDWMFLDRGEGYAIEGIEDAAVLLTVLFGHHDTPGSNAVLP